MKERRRLYSFGLGSMPTIHPLSPSYNMPKIHPLSPPYYMPNIHPLSPPYYMPTIHPPSPPYYMPTIHPPSPPRIKSIFKAALAICPPTLCLGFIRKTFFSCSFPSHLIRPEMTSINLPFYPALWLSLNRLPRP